MKLTTLALALFSVIALTITAYTLLSSTDQQISATNSNLILHQEQGFTVLKNVDNPNEFLRVYHTVTDVFGIKIYGTKLVNMTAIIHVSQLLAGFLDIDGDGKVDNQYVWETLIGRHSTLLLFVDNEEHDKYVDQVNALKKMINVNNIRVGTMYFLRNFINYDLYSMEELFHLVSYGWAYGYPNIYGMEASTNSQLIAAMDIARGGRFIIGPKKYPLNAWFTYYDNTCDYNCMIAEYFWWLASSVAGRQVFRGNDEIFTREWRLTTKEKVAEVDKLGYGLVTDPKYGVPTTFPNGTYYYNPPQSMKKTSEKNRKSNFMSLDKENIYPVFNIH